MIDNRVILFLDHDGVIVNDKGFGKRFENGTKFDPFDEMCVIRMCTVAKEMDAHIVCSSDWRNYAPLEEMQELYRSAGIEIPLIGYTEILSPIRFKEARSEIRTREILKYVKDNGVQKYMALDDLYLAGLPKNNWYRTSIYDGLIQSDMKKILEKFRAQ
jgi:hypothetical protein